MKRVHSSQFVAAAGVRLRRSMRAVVGTDCEIWEVDDTHPDCPPLPDDALSPIAAAAAPVIPPRTAAPVGLGDMVAAGLAAVGITKERVSAALGVKDCGCAKRQAALNELGKRIGIGATLDDQDDESAEPPAGGSSAERR